jgi:membrane-associated protease RseP (regulator of RpoE activity)
LSPEESSPAPHPVYASSGADEFFAVTPVPPGGRHRYWIHLVLFCATLLSTSMVGAAMQDDFERNIPFDVEHSLDMWGFFWHNPAALLHGLPFSLTLLLILLAHEFGHYIAAVFHQVDSSLPYFLPSPFLGTFGAFIRIRSPIFSKRALFDIGVAGPLAGFVFLVPALAIGLAFSKVVPGIAHQGSMHFGVPFLQWLLERAIFPGVPAGEIYLHPVARAAWVGMFATAMNLLPIGQLDGGHIFYSFFPKRHKTASKLLCVLMLPLGKFWFGWFVWGLALLWLNRRHPSIYDPKTLSPGRRKLGYLALAIFALCFSLSPIFTGGSR